ncbi:hypothetical protein VD0004_g5317 [Verticillium dahliae]|nr:hypothetical protein VD0004_g5317 [Verticillium dahliae]PNH76172.1 hypothetical protein VD0001_g1384 [Verticillium dahliae]
MTALVAEGVFGRCVPPESKYAITTNLRGWDNAVKLRDGDKVVISQIVHIYPRFGPFQDVKLLFGALAGKLQLAEGLSLLAFTDPGVFQMIAKHVTSPHRREPIVSLEELQLHVVDVADIRLYVAVFPAAKTPGVIGAWMNPGIGLSIRLSEYLLSQIDTFTLVKSVSTTEAPPQGTFLPETADHAKLRERISGLLHRASVDPEKIRVTPDDVYLYPTGMAAIYTAHSQLVAHRPGTVVILGIAFPSTIQLLLETSTHGYKHFGPVDSAGLDVFESWLGEEAAQGRDVTYVLVEFPSNPLLASVDLRRIQALSRKFGFFFVIDETVGSFANIDVLPYCDLIVTSLAKTFSGYANVMGGSAALNPLAPRHAELRKLWDTRFHNEVFRGDAAVLLANSDSYLERTAVHNTNAGTMAAYLAAQTRDLDPSSPVLRVRYPTQMPDYNVFASFLRRPAEELPEPGGGCLLTVDFVNTVAAKAFYEALQFYHGPHLGAPKTLALCYVELVFNRNPEDAEYHRGYGLLRESVRISAGLEEAGDLVKTLEVALEAARKVVSS